MNKGLLWRINQLTALYILAFSFFPPLQVGNNYRVIAVVASLIWFASVFILFPSFMSGAVRQYTLTSCALVLCLIALNSFVVGLSQAFTNNLQLIIVIIIGFIAFFYAQSDMKFYRHIIMLITISICFFCITTIRALTENAYASRIANSEWLAERFEGNERVGLYGYVYMCVLIFPSLLYLRKTQTYETRFFRLVLLIAIILILYMTINSGYLIAIVCLAVSFFLLRYYRHPGPTGILLFIFGGLSIALLYNAFLPRFFSIAYSVVGDNPVYLEKLYAFEALINKNTVTGDILGRTSNYQSSINSILRYPFLGAYILGEKTLGGGHSWILDNFARYGVLFTVLLMRLYWKTPKEIAGLEGRGNSLYKTVIIVAVLYGLADPYAQEVAIALFMYLPFVMKVEMDANPKENAKYDEALGGQ